MVEKQPIYRGMWLEDITSCLTRPGKIVEFQGCFDPGNFEKSIDIVSLFYQPLHK